LWRWSDQWGIVGSPRSIVQEMLLTVDITNLSV
jgi:hypothetical protein